MDNMKSLPKQPEQPTTQFSLHRLATALKRAKQLGFVVRSEWLAGSAAGWCEFGGNRVLFVDLSLSVHEQLEQVEAAIQTLCQDRNAA